MFSPYRCVVLFLVTVSLIASLFRASSFCPPANIDIVPRSDYSAPFHLEDVAAGTYVCTRAGGWPLEEPDTVRIAVDPVGEQFVLQTAHSTTFLGRWTALHYVESRNACFDFRDWRFGALVIAWRGLRSRQTGLFEGSVRFVTLCGGATTKIDIRINVTTGHIRQLNTFHCAAPTAFALPELPEPCRAAPRWDYCGA